MTTHDAERHEELIVDLSTVHLINLGRGMADRQIRCLSGSIWVTQAGDSRDFILNAGQEIVFESPDVVVIQAFSPALVRITPRPRVTQESLEQYLFDRNGRSAA
jgi:hypothetical protein